jgi:hypothetical protein
MLDPVPVPELVTVNVPLSLTLTDGGSEPVETTKKPGPSVIAPPRTCSSSVVVNLERCGESVSRSEISSVTLLLQNFSIEFSCLIAQSNSSTLQDRDLLLFTSNFRLVADML